MGTACHRHLIMPGTPARASAYCQVTTRPSFSPKRSRCRPVTSFTRSSVCSSSAAASMTRAPGWTVSVVVPPNPHFSTVPAGDSATSMLLPKWLASCLRYRSPRSVATRAVEVTVIRLGQDRDQDDDREDHRARGDEHTRRHGKPTRRYSVLFPSFDKGPEAGGIRTRILLKLRHADDFS